MTAKTESRANRTVRVRIHGRVQGVGFRAFLSSAASAHGVGGWVRNRHDGTVEAELTGTPDDLEQVLAAAHRGPTGGSVTRVEIEEAQTPMAPPASMSVVPTA